MPLQLSQRQLDAAVKLFLAGGGAAFWKVGTGKTRIAYKFFALNAKGKPSNFLIVCRREAFQDWIDEMEKMDIDNIGWNILEHTDQLRGKQLMSPLQSMAWIVSHGKLANMIEELENVSQVFTAVVFDEGFLYKNPKTKHCKSAHAISSVIQNALILSGSMMTARNLEDIYGQLYAINRHQSIGRTLTEFRSRYMLQLQIGSNGNSTYVNRRGSSTRIMQTIKSISSVYFPANNHRRIVSSVRVQAATSAQAKAFRKLREDFYLRYGDSELELKNTPSLIIKCQQISDGWLRMSDATMMTLPSTKQDYLLSQVQELLACGEKVVIWCAFKHTVTLLLHLMQKHFPKVGSYPFTGGMKFNRDGWKRNGRICVATEASGSSINFLKDCAYAIYYSMGFSWLNLQQSQGRTNRHDSLHQACFYYYLQTEGSLDSHVYRIVNASSKAEKDLIQLAGIKSWLTSQS